MHWSHPKYPIHRTFNSSRDNQPIVINRKVSRRRSNYVPRNQHTDYRLVHVCPNTHDAVSRFVLRLPMWWASHWQQKQPQRQIQIHSPELYTNIMWLNIHTSHSNWHSYQFMSMRWSHTKIVNCWRRSGRTFSIKMWIKFKQSKTQKVSFLVFSSFHFSRTEPNEYWLIDFEMWISAFWTWASRRCAIVQMIRFCFIRTHTTHALIHIVIINFVISFRVFGCHISQSVHGQTFFPPVELNQKHNHELCICTIQCGKNNYTIFS